VNQDFLDLLSAFNAAEVRYLVVGAYAVGVHGHARATKDLDVWVEVSADNASRIIAALRAFGAPMGDLAPSDFETVGTGFMMGLPPHRIDVLTQISGVRFQEASPRAMTTSFDGVPTSVIGFDDLVANKSSAARPQDLADVKALERLRALRNR
jgi:hypothetical protein